MAAVKQKTLFSRKRVEIFPPETDSEEMNEFKLDLHSTLLKLVSSGHTAVISRVEGMNEQRRNGLSSCVWIQWPFLQDWLYFEKLLHFTEKRRKNRLKLQAAAEVQIPLAEGSAPVFSILLISSILLGKEKG